MISPKLFLSTCFFSKKHFLRSSIFFFAIFFAQINLSISQTKYYVNSEITTTGNGLTWATSFKTFQEALSVVVAGDEVWVSKGIYKPGTAVGSTFALKSGVKYYGGFGGSETLISERLTDAENLFGVNETIFHGSNINRHVVSQVAALNAETIFDGFTVSNGKTATGNSSSAAYLGGGIYIPSGYGNFLNLRIKDNVGDRGAGIYSGSATTFKNIIFENNTSIYGAFWNNGIAVLEGVIFRNNKSTLTTAGRGGAVYNDSTLDIYNSKFIDNEAITMGGAISNHSLLSVYNSVFLNNRSANTNNTAVYGGAIVNYSGTSNIINSNIIGNSVKSNVSLGAGLYNRSGALNVYNSIVWGNFKTEGENNFNQIDGNVNIENSIVQGGFEGKNIYNIDPEFVDANAGNYALKPNSPAINNGENFINDTYIDYLNQTRIFDSKIDIGVVEYQTAINLYVNKTELTPVVRGVNYNQNIEVTGQTDGLSFTLIDGELPDGLILNSTTGNISGETLLTKSTFQFTLKITNGTAIIYKVFSLNVEKNRLRLYVNQSASGKNNGLSWENAFIDLQSALAIAKEEDEIWVAKGNYSPGNNPNDNFKLINNIKIYGGFFGNENSIIQRKKDSNQLFTVNESILNGNNINYHVVFNDKVVNNYTGLDGFTITGGKSLNLGNTIDTYGAGLLNTAGTPVFTNLRIVNNEAFSFGGGIFNSSAATFDNIYLSNNKISGITALNRYGAGIYNNGSKASFNNIYAFENETSSLGAGGGMYSNAGTVSISNSTFKLNISGNDGGGGLYLGALSAGTILNNVIVEGNKTSGSGGGIHLLNASVTFNDLTVIKNTAELMGGGVHNLSSSIFNRIYVAENTSVQNGGGFNSASGNVDIRNGIFYKNSVSGSNNFGGGFSYSASNPKITNATFYGNTVANTDNGGAGIYRAVSGTLTLSNSILWGNKNASENTNQIGNVTALGSVTGLTSINSIIQGGYIGTNILDLDPQFINSSAGNFKLLNTSPAINSGDNTKVTSLIPFDHDKNARILDTTVDIGAFEYNGSTINISPESLLGGTRGLAYSVTLSAQDVSDAVFSLTSGSLPKGLILNEQGYLSGVPMEAGNFEFSIDASNNTQFGIKNYSLNIVNSSLKIYVSEHASGANTGHDWPNALNSLSSALSIAKQGDEIWVAKGNYSPGPLETDHFYLVDGVQIYGGFAGTEQELSNRVSDSTGLFTINESVLDGKEVNHNVVFNNKVLNVQTVLDGFSIIRGLTPIATGTLPINRGAGIHNSAGFAQFRNLYIAENKASVGAGIYNLGAATFSNITLKNNSIHSGVSNRLGAGIYNTAASTFTNIKAEGNSGANDGGGIYNTGLAVFENIEIKNNSTTRNGGGIFNSGVSTFNNVKVIGNTANGSGGGFYNTAANTIINNATFQANTTNNYGGGIYTTVNLSVNQTYFIENVSRYHGGGVYKTAGTFTGENLVFSKNEVTGTTIDSYGGAFYNVADVTNINNATFSNNKIAYTYTVSEAGGAFYTAGGTVNIANSIFWGNTSSGTAVKDQLNASVKLTHSIVEGGFVNGTNILISNPEFENASAHNLKLKNSSMAINAGLNTKVVSKTDIDNLQRIVDDVVDLGAHENPVGLANSLKIIPNVIPNTTRGQQYSQILTLDNSETANVNWTLESGKLPEGFTIDNQSGLISGIALNEGDFEFVVKATNALNVAGSKQYKINVKPGNALIYVSQNATGFNNGISWTNAYNKIESALTFAKDGDQIWVAKGNYSPGLHADSSFYMISGVQMIGGFAGTETTVNERLKDNKNKFTINESILNGNSLNRHVIFNKVALDENTLLDGFTIEGGKADGSSVVLGSGAGILNNISTIKASFKNLILRNNHSNYSGGAFYNIGNSIQIQNVDFLNNSSLNGGALYNASPGLIAFSQVSFEENRSLAAAGAIYNVSTITIEDAVFKNNVSTTHSGALYTTISSNLNRVSFIGNTSLNHGGGMYINTGTHTLQNVIFSRNKVTSTGNQYGGGLYAAGTVAIYNATFSKNSIGKVATVNNGAALYSTTAKVYNSIFWGNTRGNGVADQINPTLPTVINSTVQDDFTTGVNISIADPLFKNADADDLTLNPASLAIDKGDNSFVLTNKDFAGDARIFNDIVDHGAYENQGGAFLKITPNSIPTLVRGEFLNIQLKVEGGTAPYKWNLLSGELPLGLSINESGLISGRPVLANSEGSNFAISVEDNQLQGSNIYTVPVVEGATRLYVDENAKGSNNGSSWKDAFTDLQVAINFSIERDTIWVAKGNYSPGNLVASTFLVKEGVQWIGGFEGNEAQVEERKADEKGLYTLHESILNGNKRNAHIITINTAVSNKTVIDGFTIVGGKTSTGSNNASTSGAGALITNGATVLKNLNFRENAAHYQGGAVYNTGATTFDNIRFEKNTVSSSGGALTNTNANAVFKKLSFIENSSAGSAGAFLSYTPLTLDSVEFIGNKAVTLAGALYVYGISGSVSNAVFKNNMTPSNGGAIYSTLPLTVVNTIFEGNEGYYGGAIYTSNISNIEDSKFINNHALYSGGAIYNTNVTSSNLNMDRLEFVGNTSMSHGAGVYNNGNITIFNSIFNKNKINATGSLYGAGFYHYGGTSKIVNNTFANNIVNYTHATLYGGAGLYVRNSGTVTVDNSIFWGNIKGNNVTDGVGYGVTTNLQINNSIVETGLDFGNNILIGSPMFISADNLSIRQGSAAVDAGDITKNNKLLDIELNPRVYNDVIDLGAYENQGGAFITILNEEIPAHKRGILQEIQFTASGSESKLTWSLASGDLPQGMYISAEGKFTGRPMVAGEYTFVVFATDGNLVGNKQFTFQVAPTTTRLFTNLAASGDNSGSDWINGIPNLKQALNIAYEGDSIFVAKGVYSPGNLVTDYFTLKNGVKVYGGFATTEQYLNERDETLIHSLNETILDAGQGVASRHVILNNIPLNNETLLDGFTVQGAVGATSGDNEVSRGGGIYNIGTVNATFRNLIIKNNFSMRGGGVYNIGNSVFEKIKFENNKATWAGALYNVANITISDAQFINNEVTIYAGAIYHATGNLNIDRSSFIANISPQHGAGIYHASGVANITNTAFVNNQVTTSGSYYGAGMIAVGNANLTNTTFYGNTINYKHATNLGGAGYYRSNGVSTIANSIFWNNKRANNIADQVNLTALVSNSIVENGLTSGTNILMANPNFTNVSEFNFTPKMGSPAVDAGENSLNSTALDILGNPRVYNDKIDLGAFENQGGAGLLIQENLITDFTRGQNPTFKLNATGSDLPLNWSIQSGNLPIGTYINNEGIIHGQPMVTGAFTFVVSVTDGDLSASKQYTVNVNAGHARLYVRELAEGNNNGSDWENAFNKLTSAITQSSSGDEIWVAKGNYSPGALATSFFILKDNVKWYGGFAGTEQQFIDRDTTAIFTHNAAILNGSEGVKSYHVIYNNQPLTEATVIDGFIVEGGVAANTYSSVTTNNNYFGGGLFNSVGSIALKNIWFRNNLGSFGGAVYNAGSITLNQVKFTNNQVKGRYLQGAAILNTGTLSLKNAEFESNSINETSYIGVGGAISNTKVLNLDSVSFKNNTITNGNGGAIYNTHIINAENVIFENNKASTGGAIFTINYSVGINRATFKNNNSTLTAGAIYSTSSLTLNSVYFIGNSSLQHGGAIWSNNILKIDNSVFSRNKINNASGNFYGGALYVSTGTAILSNLTFSNNSINTINASKTLSYGGALYRAGGTVNLNNSILWGNKRGNQIADQLNANIIVNNAIVENGYATGSHVKFGDPMFKDAANDDLSLKNGSLAIDAGENSLQLNAFDILGNNRVVDEVIDLGAYESLGGEKINILPLSINNFTRGIDPQFQLTAAGAVGAVVWTLESGELPIGIELNAEGKLIGIPVITGSYTFVLGAADSDKKGNRQFTIVVDNGKTKLFVDVNAKGANNGSQWKDAFIDMQTAILQSSSGDEIWVAKGTYSTGLLNSSRFVLKEGVKWYGGFSGVENNLSERDSTLIRTTNETILDGSSGVASYHVVFNNSTALTNATVVDGFSIQGGKAARTYSSGVSYNANYYGGGIYNVGGSAEFNNLWIKNNSASYGGGLFQSGLSKFKNILFSNNTANGRYPRGAAIYNSGGLTIDSVQFLQNKISESSSYPGYGAAIFNVSNLNISNAEFNENSITHGQGGAIYNTSSSISNINLASFTNNKASSGGAIFVNSGNLSVTDIDFNNNEASVNGGAIYNNATLNGERLSFINNKSVQNGGAYFNNSLSNLNNSSFSRNAVSGKFYGGAIYSNAGTLNVINNTFSKNTIAYINANTSLSYGGAIFRRTGTVNLTNSILWDNTRGNALADQLNAGIIANNNIIEGNYLPGTDIKFGNPMFTNAAQDDLRLVNGSLGIDVGTNSVQTSNIDLLGKPRVVNAVVDLGAYENDGGESLILQPVNLGPFSRGTEIDQVLTAEGTTLSTTWSFQGGKLPIGLSLTNDGHLVGTPTVVGSYTFVLGTTDGIMSGNRQYTVEVTTGPARLFVKENATGDNNGNDWINAFTDLNTAMAQAKASDEIWVAKGTYKTGPLVKNYFTLIEGVKMYGGFSGVETELVQRDTSLIRTVNETILDGNNGKASYHVVYNANAALTHETVLDGFSIQGGKALHTYSSGVSYNANYYGAGIYNVGGNAVFRNLWIKNNRAAYGGGLFHSGTATYKNIKFSNNSVTGRVPRGGAIYNNGDLVLDQAEFENNGSTESASYPGYGAAIYSVINGSFTNVEFKNNKLLNGSGGAIFSSGILNLSNAKIFNCAATRGGALYINGGKATISEIELNGGTALNAGGAIFKNSGTLLLNNAKISNFISSANGGAIYNSGALTISNSVITNNSIKATSAQYGGAIYSYTGVADIINSTIVDNSIAYTNSSKTNFYGGGVYRRSGTLTLNNSIVWNNKRGNNVFDQLGGVINVNNAIVKGGYANGKFVIDADPLFEAGTYQLTSCSPAINLGDNKFNAQALDLAGNERISSKYVDLGAYEYQNITAVIDPEVLPSGNRGVNYEQQLTVEGGSEGYTFQVISGKLPDGLDMKSDGLIYGSPLANGKYEFAVSVSNGSYCGNRFYSIDVVPGTGVVKIFVSEAATSGRNNGSSWTNAYLTLSRAFEIAQKGDEIWVAKGTYSPGNLVTSTFTLKEGIKLYGGFSGVEDELTQRDSLKIRTDNETILDGKGINRHIIYNIQTLTNATVVDGFTLKNGKTNISANAHGYGGAIYNRNGAILFKNLWLKDNTSYGYGGAVYSIGAVTFDDVIFENNQTTNTTYGYGGAVYASGATIFNKVVFKNNFAGRFGGAMFVVGTPSITNANFINNSSNTHGGALFFNSGTLILKNAAFSRNKVNTSGYFGGAIYHNSGTSNLTHITIANNSINYVNASKVNFYGAGLYRRTGSVNLNNSILWNNIRGNAVPDQLNASIIANNNLIQGGYKTGKIVVELDPQFNLIHSDDLSLSNCSPAINMGNNVNSAGITTDLDGNTRVSATIVDLGAYENQSERLTIEPTEFPEILRGKNFKLQLNPSGSNGNYKYSITYGKLPDGLKITEEGLVVGKPILVGEFSFNVNVSDGTICGNYLYTVEVKPGDGGARLYVNQAATAGMNNGADWENGYLDLQTAIKNSFAADSIWVAKGNYSPGALATSYFILKEGVKIFGGFGGTENELVDRDSTLINTANETILNGNNKSYHVIYNKLTLTNATEINGFSIQGGKTASGRSTEAYIGAGIYNLKGNVIFKNLWIKNNTSYAYGAGMYNTGAATIENVIFENNKTTGNGTALGGGLYNNGASTITNVSFINNNAYNGGGLYNINASVNVTNSYFKGNSARISGGAVFIRSGVANFANIQILENQSVRHGGGFYHQTGTAKLTNALFDNNKVTTGSSSYRGGAFYNYNGTSIINNATFTNNKIAYAHSSKTTSYGGALNRNAGTVTVANSIFWNNFRGNNVADNLSANVNISNSDVQGGYAKGTKIIDIDPLFKNLAGGDLSLTPCSPLINLGDNSKVSGFDTDILGNTRLMHGKVDLGAIEYQDVYLEAEESQLPDATQWNFYEHQILVGENTNYTYTISMGLLPDGLNLQANGMLSGEPTVPGDFEFVVAVNGSDICGNVPFKLTVKEQDPYIIEVLNPYPLPIDKYTGTEFSNLELPTQIEVILSDKTKTFFPVKWNPGEYNKDLIDIYYIKGDLIVPTPEVNRNNLYAEIKVAVVDPVFPYIVEVAPLDSLMVLSGTSFNEVLTKLPTQIQVTYDTGEKENLSLIWKPEIYNSNPGIYRLFATLVLTKENSNPADFEAQIDVYVQRNIISVEKLPEVYVDRLTPADDLPLPNQVRVTYHDNSTAMVNVIWDKTNYVNNLGGEYLLKGHLQLTNLISNTSNIQAEINVIIRKNVESVSTLLDVSTLYGTEFELVELPETVNVTFDDNTTDTIGVEWLKGNYNELISGKYPLQGTLVHSDEITNSNNISANVNLIVLEKYLNIISIAAIDTVKVPYGTALNSIQSLKNKINVNFDNSSSGSLNVEWDIQNYDPEQPGLYTYLGTPVLVDGVSNNEELRAEIILEIENKSIIKAENPIDINVPYGTIVEDIPFPENVNVTYNNQSNGTEEVVFSSENYNPEQSDTYNFIGELTISDDILNPNNLQPSVNVIVGPKPFNILSINQDTVTVPYLSSFVDANKLFTSTVTATLDNGTTREIPVVWNEGEYNNEVIGEIVLNGELTLPEDVTNLDNIASLLTVIVDNRIVKSVVTINYTTVPYSTEFDDIEKSSPLAVTYEDGGTEELNIIWEEGTYNPFEVGEYLIEGQIDIPEGVSNPTPVYALWKVIVGDKAKNIIEIKTDTVNVAFGTEVSDIPFPVTVKAVLDDQSVVDLAVVKNSFTSDDYQRNENGFYLFEGDFDLPEGVANPDNISLYTIVGIENKAVSSILNPDLITVPFGTSYSEITLPTHVQVTFNDQSTDQVAVEWNNINYDGNVSGVYTLSGILDLSNDIENPNNLQPSLMIEVLEEVKIIASLKADTISVPFGTLANTITYPTKVLVTYTNGSIAELEVNTFENTNYDANNPGVYKFIGELVLPKNVQNPDELKPELFVQVEEKYIISITPPDTIHVAYNTTFDNIGLPAEVEIIYNDNSKGTAAVNWSEQGFNGSIAGVYNLTGTLIESYLNENKDQLVAKIPVVVAVKLFEIESAPQKTPYTFPFGTSLDDIITALGTEIPVNYIGGTEGISKVEWFSSNFELNKAGEFNFTGVLTPAQDASNPADVEAMFVITINKRNIIAIEQPTEILDAYGKSFTDIPWPLKVLVTYNDLSQSDVDVIWNQNEYNPYNLNKQLVGGNLILDDSQINTDNLLTSIFVTLFKNIEKVDSIPTVEVEYGTLFNSLGLPNPVEVTYNDGSSEMLNVIWPESEYLAMTPGEYTLNGAITLVPNTLNENGLTADVIIKIKKAKQEITLQTIDSLVYGDAPIKLNALSTSKLPITFELVEGNVNLSNDTLSINGVGEVIIKATQVGNDLYESAVVEQKFNINKALLTVTADSLSRRFVEVNPVLTYNISGFVYDETEVSLRESNALTGDAVLNTTAVNGSAVGAYPIVITLGDLAATNYDFELIDAEITITENEHVVTFETNGGIPVTSVKVLHENLLPYLETTKDGNSFYAWYTDKTLETAYNFDVPVTSNLTLFADFRLNPLPTTGPISQLQIADYMVLLGELTSEERSKPVPLSLLAAKSHLPVKTAPFKLSNWRGYGQIKKAIVKTKPSVISGNSITTGAIINSSNDALIIESGVVYGINSSPTIDNDKINATGLDFDISIPNIASGTTYFIKAFTISDLGVSYGNEIIITIP